MQEGERVVACGENEVRPYLHTRRKCLGIALEHAPDVEPVIRSIPAFEVHDDVAPECAGADEDILLRSPDELIVARSPDEAIASGSAEKGIVARTAQEGVVSI